MTGGMWFREVGPVRPSVTNDCECIEMSNFKLGFFAPFLEYHFLIFINSQRPHVVDGGWVSSAGLFLWPWPVPCKSLVWWDLVILYNNYSLKQDVEHSRGVVCPSGNLNCLTNLSLVVFSWFFFFFIFIVLPFISLRSVNQKYIQMCQGNKLPFWVFQGSPDHVDPPFSLLIWKNRVSDISPAERGLWDQQSIVVWGLQLWRFTFKSPKGKGKRSLS